MGAPEKERKTTFPAQHHHSTYQLSVFGIARVDGIWHVQCIYTTGR
jgi:hypothetical protein